MIIKHFSNYENVEHTCISDSIQWLYALDVINEACVTNHDLHYTFHDHTLSFEDFQLQKHGKSYRVIKKNTFLKSAVLCH